MVREGVREGKEGVGEKKVGRKNCLFWAWEYEIFSKISKIPRILLGRQNVCHQRGPASQKLGAESFYDSQDPNTLLTAGS